ARLGFGRGGWPDAARWPTASPSATVNPQAAQDQNLVSSPQQERGEEGAAGPARCAEPFFLCDEPGTVVGAVPVQLPRRPAEALWHVAGFDPELWSILWLTLRVSGAALLISTLVGVPLGAWLGLTRFPGRSAVLAVVHTGM